MLGSPVPRWGRRGVDVRGGSPGTRETDLLRPGYRVDRLHAVVLSGGSAFGLDAASGVVRYLEENGIGYPAGPALVPIVSSAILFDLGVGNSKVRPGPEEGYAACLATSTGPVAQGSVGAGAGATVAKARGLERSVKSGIGSASLTLRGGATVAALVAVNAIGGIFDHRTGRLLAGPRMSAGLDAGLGMEDPVEALFRQDGREDAGGGSGVLTNTTIGVVATDAALSREAVNYLAGLSHDGLALAIRPCHTLRDGDTMFAMATGRFPGPVDPVVLGAAVVETTAAAVLNALRSATSLGGVPSLRDLGPNHRAHKNAEPLIVNRGQPTIGFIGIGLVGRALGLALDRQGYRVNGMHSRTLSSARDAAAQLRDCQVYEEAQDLCDAVGPGFHHHSRPGY